MGLHAYPSDWLDDEGRRYRRVTDIEVGDKVMITTIGLIGEVTLVNEEPFTMIDVRYSDKNGVSYLRGFYGGEIRRLTWDEIEQEKKRTVQEDYNYIVRDAVSISGADAAYPFAVAKQLMAHSTVEKLEDGDRVCILNTGDYGHIFQIRNDPVGGVIIQVLHDNRKYFSYRPSELRKVLPGEEAPLRCGRCKGPYHPATGHMFTATDVACGPCAGRFWAWMIYAKQGWHYSKKKHRLVRHEKKRKGSKGFRGFHSF